MRTARAVIAGASVTLAAWVFAAGCKSNTASGPGLGDDSLGNNAGTSSGGGTTSGSSGGSTAGGSPSAPSADYSDGGISCGPQGACAPSEQCCYAPAPAAEAGPPGLGGFGGFGGGPTTSCTPAGSCAGSSLSCSSPSHCAGGQVCCFAYTQSEAGAGPGGFAGFAAPMMGFSAECADNCPTGDMVHYALCASSTDCPSGQSCIRGTYTTYCANMGPTNPQGGGPTNPQGGGDGGSD